MKNYFVLSVSFLFWGSAFAAKTSNQTAALSLTDTVRIGSNREIKSLDDYFAGGDPKENVHILVDEGTYYSNGLWINAQHVVIEGRGQVNLYCTLLYENVLWISGEDILVKNFHMKHFVPGTLEGQNCSGRVIGFDGAHNVTIEGCDLNGCGLAGLHDNLMNSNILIKNNYIHNNSIGAYTDIEGGVWMEAIDDHPVFRFENNRIENNGPTRSPESDSIDDFIITCPENYREELSLYIDYERAVWKSVPNPLIVRFEGSEFGDYYHLIFKDSDENTYDFGFGNNDFGDLQLFSDDEEMVDNELYLGKQFKVYWDWRAASFPCCSGEYEMVEAFTPSIVSLELVKKTEKKVKGKELRSK